MSPPITTCNSIVIRSISPEIDGGRYPIKRFVDEEVDLKAEIFSHYPYPIFACIRYRHEAAITWTEVPLREFEKDHWTGSFQVTKLGRYRYTVDAWSNPLLAWWLGIERIANAKQSLIDEAAEGLALLQRALQYATTQAAMQLRECIEGCRSESGLRALLNSPAGRTNVSDAIAGCRDPDRIRTYPIELPVIVDPILARFGAWYQIFPRSCSKSFARHGTLRDLVDRLPRIAEFGFDVVYIPPIHPIGAIARKGKNNALAASDGDPGSPWAIGAREGGHKQIHPELGTEGDFGYVLSRAGDLGLTIALDIALQCSPDHPYVRDHPEWFLRRPDGSIRCAEDPPNKYEDVYPFDFECERRVDLWKELRSIFVFWIERGVRVFRVDNPHTKPFDFWEWLIDDLKHFEPSLILLAEGLTHPSGMVHLGRVGFTQSYDYFPWRNTKAEIIDHYQRLNEGDVSEFFRPVLWPNTPQYLSPAIQQGGMRALLIRAILASTLGASYGIYGPVYELCDTQAVSPGSTEYFDSEQYQIRFWDWDRRTEITDLLRLLNCIRRENPALQSNARLYFHKIDNEQLLAFSKTTKDQSNRILIVACLGSKGKHDGWTELSLEEIGLSPLQRFIAHDLLTGARYPWQGTRNYVDLTHASFPAHILRLE